MKQLSLRRILWMILCVGFIFYASCKKDDSISSTKEIIYNNLTPEQLAQSPYFTSKKYDTLSFFNTKGDTFTFGKVKTDTNYNSVWVNDLGNDHTKIYMHQYLHNTYQTLKGDGRFEVWHKTKSVTNSIVINIDSKEFSYESDRVGRDLNNWPFYSDYKIGDQLFKNVTMFNPLLDNSAYIYVNVDDGLITFINNQTSDTLQLIKK